MTLSETQRKCLWGFLVVIALLRILLMFQLPFMDTTEARYAEIARKMVETNDWVTPQFDYGVPFWGKPPLHTWLSAVGMKLFGVGQFGARIFIFVTAVATLWMLYLWARAIQGRDYALVGVSVLASSALYYIASAEVMTDLVMAAGVYMSMAGFYTAVSQQKDAHWWGYLFFVGLGIGMLAKGPVAVVLTAIPIGMWVFCQNRWVDTWKRLPWVEGSLVTCCIFMPWYVLAEIKTPGFLHYFIVGEHFQRFLQSGWDGDLYGHGHAEARGMIWFFWFAAALPWSFFFLATFRWSGRLYRGIKNEGNGWSLYLLCWALSPMLFFTLATNIIATYVITGLPAMCFLLIDFWRHAGLSTGGIHKYLVRSFAATAVVVVVIFMGVYGSVILRGEAVVHKSQKYMIEQIHRLCALDSGDIYYFKKRYYSAEFYSAGRVHTIESVEDLEKLQHNQSLDFLVVRKKDVSRLPEKLFSHFKFEGYHGKEALYYERSSL
jgi:4-amino-4-deoxy-L-arabinose transferase-like glycosyltransferase